MLYPLDQLEKQLSRTEHHLMYHLILEQQETNRMLHELTRKEEQTLSQTVEVKRRGPKPKREAV